MKHILQKTLLLVSILLVTLIFFQKILLIDSYANNSPKKEIIEHIVSSNWFIVASIINWEIYYHHKNYLWSTVFLTNKNWEQIKKFEYDSFGDPIYPTIINFHSEEESNKNMVDYFSAFELLRRFTNHSFDSNIWLYYAKSRYYDPKNHKFLTADPKRQFDNTYSYVWNNPINYIDPDGKGFWDIFFKVKSFFNEILSIPEETIQDFPLLNETNEYLETENSDSLSEYSLDIFDKDIETDLLETKTDRVTKLKIWEYDNIEDKFDYIMEERDIVHDLDMDYIDNVIYWLKPIYKERYKLTRKTLFGKKNKSIYTDKFYITKNSLSRFKELFDSGYHYISNVDFFYDYISEIDLFSYNP